MKLTSPRLLAQLENGNIAQMTAELSLEDAQIIGEDMTNCVVLGLDLSGVLLDKVTLTSAQLERINARDLLAKQCDFSAASLAAGAINRAEFKGCRMTGVDTNKTSLHDVVFHSCKLDMANFRFADLRRVQFVDCTLTEADFLGATLHDVAFQSCTLEKTIFEQAKCKQVDLRTSELIEVVGWRSLKGATIDDLQLASIAPYLAQELGLIVGR